MDKVLRHYNTIFDKAWLGVSMASQNAKSFERGKEEEKSCATLLAKPGHMDLIESRSYTSGNVDNWEQVQDRILRVLTYKYLDCDLALVHVSDNYLYETASTSCSEEQEIENLHLQDFAELLTVPIEVEVTRLILPVLEHPQILTLGEDNPCGRAWKCIRNALVLKTCRRA